MTTAETHTDRRAALKARHREAILGAADALIGERGSRRFTVDELADRADISRRTVFNHFASLDDVVLAACTRVLTRALDEFRLVSAARPNGDGTPAALFAELTTALHGVDLPGSIAYIAGVLGEEGDPRSHHLIQDVFVRTNDVLAQDMILRAPDIDVVEAQILVSSVLNGVAVIAGQWMGVTGGALDRTTRLIWDGLLERMVAAVGRGYMPDR